MSVAGPSEDPAAATGPVLAVNDAFYDAFERRDIDAMSALWEHSDRVFCTHPGWRTLHGWGAVAGSWFALFQNAEHLQFIVTEPQPVLLGDAAYVTCEENILGGGVGGTMAALNVFARDGGGGWKMIGHHASPVVPT